MEGLRGKPRKVWEISRRDLCTGTAMHTYEQNETGTTSKAHSAGGRCDSNNMIFGFTERVARIVDLPIKKRGQIYLHHR